MQNKPIHCLYNNEYIKYNLNNYLEYQGYQLKKVNPTEYKAKEVLLIAEPYKIGRDGYSLHLFWRRYLNYNSKHIKLIVCGYSPSKHTNYLNLVNPPQDFSVFLNNAIKVSDIPFKIEEVETPSGVKTYVKDSWNSIDNTIPTKGIPFIKERYNLFFDGHNKFDSLTHQRNEVHAILALASHLFYGMSIDFEEIRTLLIDETATWETFYNRWERYRKNYFNHFPFGQTQRTLNIQIQNLNDFFKELPEKVSSYRQNKALGLIENIKLYLDELAKYTDGHFGKDIPLHNPLSIPTTIDTSSRKEKPLILLVEDEEFYRKKIFEASFSPFFKIRYAINEQQARETISDNINFKLIVLDLDLVGDRNYDLGIDLIKEWKKNGLKTPIVVWTADDMKNTGIEAMAAGAKYYLEKSKPNIQNWLDKFDKVIAEYNLEEEHLKLKKEQKKSKHLEERIKKISQKYLQPTPFISRSKEIALVKEDLKFAAKYPDTTVLITGETGVGKEVCARYLYQHSDRFGMPFIVENLTATSKGLLESKLFGHKKGSFTGADQNHEGIFQRADGGILFLDEIGEISQDMQVKLLRVIEYKEITPVGGDELIDVDIHIITATNKNLKEAVENGSFRRDLYQRLAGEVIEIPPLRERPEDILAIMGHFLGGLTNEQVEDLIEKEALELLRKYTWSGNVRELLSVTKKLSKSKIRYNLDKITVDTLPDEIKNYRPFSKNNESESNSNVENNQTPSNIKPKTQVENKGGTHEEALAITELENINEALRICNGSKSKAANMLNMSDQQLRYRVVKKYNVQYERLIKKYKYIVTAYENYL